MTSSITCRSDLMETLQFQIRDSVESLPGENVFSELKLRKKAKIEIFNGFFFSRFL